MPAVSSAQPTSPHPLLVFTWPDHSLPLHLQEAFMPLTLAMATHYPLAMLPCLQDVLPLNGMAALR